MNTLLRILLFVFLASTSALFSADPYPYYLIRCSECETEVNRIHFQFGHSHECLILKELRTFDIPESYAGKQKEEPDSNANVPTQIAQCTAHISVLQNNATYEVHTFCPLGTTPHQKQCTCSFDITTDQKEVGIEQIKKALATHLQREHDKNVQFIN